MNSKVSEIFTNSGIALTCCVIEATHPRSGLPCVYAAFLSNSEEIASVRFKFQVMYLLTIPFNWPAILDQTLDQIVAGNWVDKALGNLGQTVETEFSPS
jgi:hypothetical protein